MFSKISQAFKALTQSFKKQLHTLFSKRTIDEQTIQELYTMLLSADVGVTTTNDLIGNIKTSYQQGTIQSGKDLEEFIKQALTSYVTLPTPNIDEQQIIVLVGINGSGKTTLAAKLSHYFSKERHKKVLLAAGDTFRAAATQQLNEWAQKTGADIAIGKENQDPASVIFDACSQFNQAQHDVLIIDTAGRLQTKENLMKELEKIKRIINKAAAGKKVCTLLTVDALLGQSSLQQAHVFHESTQLDGIVLTKMDSSGKGGIAFAISHELKLPVILVSLGEKVEALEKFDASAYVDAIMSAD